MTDISDEAAGKATSLILDVVATILASDPDSSTYLPVRAVLVYEFMREDGSISMQNFGTNGMWDTDAIGMLELAKQVMIVDYLHSGSNDEKDEDDDHNHPSQS